MCTDIIRSEKGFVLLAAIMACLILLAVGLLVITVSTSDLRVSARMVAEKKAMSAVESGLHNFTQTFNPAGDLTQYNTWIPVDPAKPTGIRYMLKDMDEEVLFKAILAPYEELKTFKQLLRYRMTVVGQCPNCYGGDAQAEVVVGIGYGPVPSSPSYGEGGF